MLRRIVLCAALLLAACGGSGASAPEAPDPLAAWIAAETERLSEAAGVLGDDAGEAREELARIAAEAEAGRALHALSRIPSIRPRIEARQYRSERLESVAELPALEAETEQHAAFIALNAEIKEARDLLAAGRVDGALLAVLEPHRRLAGLADDDGATDGEALRRRAGEMRKRIEAAGWDASTGRLMLETAEDALAAPAPSAGALRRARALLLHVLPRYFELHQPHQPHQETP